MTRTLLIVDDDADLLLMTKEGLEKYSGTFSVLTAENGEKALEELRRTPVSLVVTDLKMPQMDGFSLLTHIIQDYPDIPVIVMTGFGTPELEKKVNEDGAIGYIQKPFTMKELARKIVAVLRQQADGGMLHGFATGVFVQLVEMEQKTCTIRVYNRRTREKGVLFFREGDLMDARTAASAGLEAAYSILSWDEVSLSIQNTCPQNVKRIDGDLQGILLEAMRQKDEENPGDDEGD